MKQLQAKGIVEDWEYEALKMDVASKVQSLFYILYCDAQLSLL
jgi:hypothetical protein